MNLKVSADVAALNPEIDFADLGRPKVGVKQSFHDDLGPYRSQLEQRVANEWIPTLNPIMWGYEPHRFDLDGVRYTPDFILLLPDLSVVVVEAKGEYHNRRATRQVFRQLCHRYADIFFCWLEWKDRDWQEEWFMEGKKIPATDVSELKSGWVG